MPTDALKQVTINRLAVGVVIAWTRSDGKTLRLYASDGRFTTLTADSKPFYPVLVQHDDIVLAGEETSFAFTMAMDGNFAVEISPGYTYEQYVGLAAVLRKYPEMLRSPLVTFVLEGHADDGTVTYEELAVATIDSVINTTAQSMSFSCTLVDDAEEEDMPVRETGIDAMAGDEDPYDDTKGNVLPVSFGDFHPVSRWQFLSHSWLKYWQGIFGWAIPAADAVPVGRRASDSSLIRAAYSERIDTSLGMTPTAQPGVYLDVGGRIARVYNQWFDQDGTSHVGIDGADVNKTQYYGVGLDERPYVQMYVEPIPLDDSSGTKAARAVDRDPNTYAVMTDGQTLRFSLPRVSLPGRLSLNSTDAGTDAVRDFEGYRYPVGIKVIALVANYGTVARTGSVTLAFTFDDDSPYLYGEADECSVTILRTIYPGEAALFQLNVPFQTGVLRQGWAGTKWQTGDFSAGQNNDLSDPDYPIWRSGCEGYPMRIAVTNNMGGSMGLAAVGPLLGLRANTNVTKSAVLIENRKYHVLGKKDITWDAQVGIVKGNDDVFDLSLWTGGGAWGRGPRNADPNWHRHEYERMMAARKPTAESNVKVARAMHVDDAAGKYTGTVGKTLTQPIEMSRAAMQIYGGVADALIRSGTDLGSYEVAREAVRDWYSGGVSDLDWSVVSQIMTKTPAGAAADEYLRNCLGMKRKRYPDGRYGWYHWGPVSSLHASRFYQSGTPIEVEQMLLLDGTPDDPRSSPQIRVGHTGRRSVINSVRVQYRGELRHVASCDWDGSSNGDFDEAEWPALPYSSSMLPGGVGGLCDISRLRFGERRTPPFDFSETYDPRVAVGYGMYLLARGWQPEPTLDLLSGLGLYDLWEGHVFRLSNAISSKIGLQPPFWGEGIDWENLYWMCVSNVVESDGLSLSCRVRAIWLPYTIGPMGRGGAFAGSGEEMLVVEGLEP